MPDFLDIEGYIFEMETLKETYHAVPPASRADSTGYNAAALRALVRYFADWGPGRTVSVSYGRA
jgi:hypothetical protein